MRAVLDKRFVAECRFDQVPVIDSSGKWVGTEPNTKNRFYDVGDLHKDAPVGFALRVNRRSKVYIVTARQGSKVVTSKVGLYPDLLLGKDVPPERNARHLAAELLARIRRGVDVNEVKRMERVAAKAGRPTLQVLFEQWLAEYRSSAKRDPRPNTVAAVTKAMDRLGVKLLERDAADITWRDLEGFFTDKAIKKGHLTAAEQTIRWVSAVYNKANHRMTLDALQEKTQPQLYVNPAGIFIQTGQLRDGAELQRDYDKKGVRRPLSGKHADFAAWMDYVLDARNRASARTGADYMLVTVILGLRRNETMGLLWHDRISKVPAPSHAMAGLNFIDLDNAVLVLNQTKNRYQHRLPIPGFLTHLLQERRVFIEDSPWVFPRVSKSKLAKSVHYNDPRAFLESVKRAIKVAFGVHDLRRTFGNVVTNMELPDRLAKQLLNHKSSGATGRYTDQSLEQLRVVMERVEDEMLGYATTSPKAALNIKLQIV